MPHLRIQTNVKLDEAKRQQLLKAASSLIAKELSKPESYVMVSLNDDASMLFAGSNDALAYVHLESLGYAKAPSEITPVISQLLQEHLQIEPSRLFIRFDDIARENYAWNGSTFA